MTFPRCANVSLFRQGAGLWTATSIERPGDETISCEVEALGRRTGRRVNDSLEQGCLLGISSTAWPSSTG